MKVLTVDGQYINKSECIAAGSKFYAKVAIDDPTGLGIVRIGKKDYRTERLYFNHNEKQWKLPGKYGTGVGVYSLSPFVKGMIDLDPLKVCNIRYKGGIHQFHDVNKLPKAYKYDPNGDYYVSGYNITDNQLFSTQSGFNHFNTTSIYGAEGNSMFTKFMKEPKLKPKKGVFSKYLDDITYGIEIETSAGRLPEHYCFEKKLIPVKDGSIQGYEYITLPLTGAQGVDYLGDVFDKFSTLTKVDEFCSLHIHFGNTLDSKEFTNALYFLCYRLQNEIQELFPPFKKSTEYYKKKEGKDHCEFLPRLGIKDDNGVEDNFRRIVTMLNEGDYRDPRTGDDFTYSPGSVLYHKKNGVPKYKWNKRYFWVNFIPLLFKKQKTVEFRFHSGTVNKHKVLPWLLICRGIINFATNNPKKCMSYTDKVSLYDVLTMYQEDPFIFDYLLGYIDHRKTMYSELSVLGEIYGNEFQTDNTFDYKVNNLNLYEWEKEQAKGTQSGKTTGKVVQGKTKLPVL